MNQEEYLKERLEAQINWYDRKSQCSQKWCKLLQVFQLVAAAVVPFLAGYMSPEVAWLKFVVGVLGVLISISGSVILLYKLQDNWMEYRKTCELLKHEKYLFLTKTGPYETEKPFELLVKRVEAQISKENSNWAQYMKKEPPTKKA